MLLRDYQLDAKANIRAAACRVRRVLFYGAPGAGKTNIFCSITYDALVKGNQTWILVDKLELAGQTVKTLKAWEVPHGILGSGLEYDGQSVQIAMVKTLAGRIKKGFMPARPPEVIIVDECDLAAAESWQVIFRAFPKARILGFSGSPERLDGKPLGDMFDDMVYGPPVSWLMDNGHLARCNYFGVPMSQQPDLEGVDLRIASEVSLAMEAKPTITGDVVANYLARARGVPFLGFAVDIAAAIRFAAAFDQAGISCGAIHGDEKRLKKGSESDQGTDTRYGLVNSLRAGRVMGLWSVQIFGRGVDVPAVKCGIDCAPTASLAQMIQRMGRVLRPTVGPASWFDHVGNLMRHGTAEMPREWSLEGVSKSKRAKELIEQVKQCPGCYGWFPMFTGPCPRCAHVAPVKTRVLKTVRGTLKELSASEIDAGAVRAKTAAEVEKEKLHSLRKQGFARGVKNPHKFAHQMRNQERAARQIEAVRQVLLNPNPPVNDFLERRKAFLKNTL